MTFHSVFVVVVVVVSSVVIGADFSGTVDYNRPTSREKVTNKVTNTSSSGAIDLDGSLIGLTENRGPENENARRNFANSQKMDNFSKLIWKVKVKVKADIALHGTLSQSYGTSLAIWDHTVLPATRHK